MKNKPNVLLISPQIITGKEQIRKVQVPLGLASLGAMLELNDCAIVRIFDTVVEGYNNVVPLENSSNLLVTGSSNEAVFDEISAFKPDVIGVSCLYSSQAVCAFSMISAIKKKYNNIPIILGGNHASVSYDVIMHNNPGIDFIIRGESEYTFLEFVKKIGTGTDVTGVPSLVWREGSEIRNNPLSPVIGSLDDLPFPAWHLLSMESYFEIAMPPNPFIQSGRVGVIMTSRGCPFKCYFCSSTNFFGHRFRPMSSSCVIEMVRLLVKSYGIKELQIVDDTFTTDFRRVIEICKGLKQFNLRITLPNGIRADSPKNRMQRAEMFHVLREAGCVQIAIAAEHGDQDFLNNVINKKLNLDETNATCDFAHRAGLLVHCNFIMGFPFETSELRNRTIEYANKLQADSFSVSLATPLPGTRMWDIAEENDLFLDGFNESRVIFSQASIKPHDIEVEELEQLVKRLNHDLNANAVKRNPDSKKKYNLFKEKDSSSDRKYLH